MTDFKFNPAMCFHPSDIVRYLDAGDIIDNKLHNELIASLVVQGVHKVMMEWDNIFLYFIPKDGRQKELIEAIGSTVLREDVLDFFQKNVEENSEFDVIVIDRTDQKMAEYRPIQLKRFGIRIDPDKLTEEFLKFLDKKIMLYAKNKGSLYVYLENKGTLQFAPITEHLKSIDFPFEELTVFALNERGNFNVCQLYPTADEVITFEIERSIAFPGKSNLQGN